MGQARSTYFLIFLLTLLTLNYSSVAFAQTIDSIDDDEVQISLGDLADIAEGTKLFATDENGKKKAIIEITNVDENSANGKIIKGNAEVGYNLTLPGAKPKKVRRKSKNDRRIPTFEFLAGARAVFGTFSVGGNTVSGSGFSFMGEVDYRVQNIALGVEIRYAMVSWNSNSFSTGIMDLGFIAKYRFENLALIGGLAPSSTVTSTTSVFGGPSLLLGASYSLSSSFELVFELKNLSLTGATMTPIHLGLNYNF